MLFYKLKYKKVDLIVPFQGINWTLIYYLNEMHHIIPILIHKIQTPYVVISPANICTYCYN